MPSNLVRITLDKKKTDFTVEYGESHLPGLTSEEEKELEQLNEDLLEYSDFTIAEKLQDEDRQKLMAKKKRLEELTEKKVREYVTWLPIEANLIDTLLIICNPMMRHTYVENLPPELLKKLFEPQMSLNLMPFPVDDAGSLQRIPKVEKPESEPEETPLQGRSVKEVEVIRVVASAKASWGEYVSIKQENGSIIVTPHKFLGDDWGPINLALKKAYGDVWKSMGSGDKSAHWKVE
uniref:Uncharacterized protein n=1 Tax=viral metagenome TaxID=1070528 RepID=A0A6M3M0Z9_9ZZZZ